MQVHYGQDEPGGWHVDASNSLLHIGVSIRGVRTLLCEVHEDAIRRPRAPGAAAGERPVRREALWPGTVYVATPALFAHAVEYTSCAAFEDRILAVQARFLLTGDAMEELGTAYGEDDAPLDRHALAWAVSSAIADAGALVMPTLREVEEVLSAAA